MCIRLGSNCCRFFSLFSLSSAIFLRRHTVVVTLIKNKINKVEQLQFKLRRLLVFVDYFFFYRLTLFRFFFIFQCEDYIFRVSRFASSNVVTIQTTVFIPNLTFFYDCDNNNTERGKWANLGGASLMWHHILLDGIIFILKFNKLMNFQFIHRLIFTHDELFFDSSLTYFK